MLNNNRGNALPITLILLVVIFSSAIWILERNSQNLKHAVMFRKQHTATALANNMITDLMRQFSQAYQGNHFGTDALERNPAFYNKGYSLLSSTANKTQHFIFFEASGSYGTDESNPQHRKKITGVIKFISDLTTYGTMWKDAFTTSSNDVIYSGKLWANGGWTISGDNIQVNGGPLLVNGNIATSGGGDLVINGDLYRTGTRTGNITVNGNEYNFLPDLIWPVMDTTYFNTYSNVKVTGNTSVRFHSNGTVNVGTTVYTIPSDGLVIFVQNGMLTTSGTVKGHVTITSLRVSGSSGGNVTVDGDLKYATASSTSSANPSDSLGVISTHGHTWTRAGANQYRHISGVFWIDTGGTSTEYFDICSGGSATSGLKFYGTRNKMIRTSGGTCVTLGSEINYDPNLDAYPPPGLPEKPYLVSWQIQ